MKENSKMCFSEKISSIHKAENPSAPLKWTVRKFVRYVSRIPALVQKKELFWFHFLRKRPRTVWMVPSFSTDDSALVCTIALLQTPSELGDTPRQRQTGGSDPRTPPESSGSEGLLGKRWLWGKSRNFSTEGCPKSDVLGVGTWKMVTHGFNTNDLWKINFYFEIFIFSKKFRSERKLFFRKFTKFTTLQNSEIFEFPKISIFSKTLFFVSIEKKMKT